MSDRYTHVLEIYPEKEEKVMGQKIETHVIPMRYILSRWDTGLIVGEAQGVQMQTVDWEKQKTIASSYRDPKYAVMALKRYADEDARKTLDQPHAFIEEIDKSKKILEYPSIGR